MAYLGNKNFIVGNFKSRKVKKLDNHVSYEKKVRILYETQKLKKKLNKTQLEKSSNHPSYQLKSKLLTH